MTVVSDISYWKPVYQLFKPDKPLVKDELRDFYVRREDSPVDGLVSSLAMNEAAKFLLAGHRGGGKTTELRRLEQRCAANYTVVWVDTDTALDKFNIGHAEVTVLIGMQIVQQLATIGWQLPKALEKGLWESLAEVTYQDKTAATGQIELPKMFQELGMLLRVGFQTETTRKMKVNPVLKGIVDRVNDIIVAAEKDKPKLLVIVDGLDRKEYSIAFEMFSSSLLTDLNCHIVYTIPISLRYSSSFREPMQMVTGNLDLDNIPVFKYNAAANPAPEANKVGRHILADVVQKRLATLDKSYVDLFEPKALDLICEKSGGVMRDLVRLAQKACEVALKQKATKITHDMAFEAVEQERRSYTIEDYQYPELDTVRRTGKLTNNTFDAPKLGKVVICNELLHYKLVLGYHDPKLGHWFDVNPILWNDLDRWQQSKESNDALDRPL
jgi:hypothetical protein